MTKVAPYWMRLATGIVVLSAGLGMPAHSQQAAERSAMQGSQPGANKPAKPPAAKPGTTKPATARSPDVRAPQTRPWTLEDALPSRNRARDLPTTSSAGLGRVPVEGGTFGFSAESQVDPYKTPDGSRIRGLERASESEPSYLGLSLSVRNDEKSILPRSVLPNW